MINFKNSGFLRVTWRSFELVAGGITLCFGWFPTADLIGFQLSLLEWVDAIPGGYSAIVLFKLQVLYFMFYMILDRDL